MTQRVRVPDHPAASPAPTASGSLPKVSLRSAELDEALEIGGRVLHPHRLTVVDGGRFGISLHLVSLGPLNIGWLRYDSAMRIESAHPDHYQVNIPTAGVLPATSGGQEVIGGPGLATVYNPGRQSTLTVTAPLLALRIGRRALDHELEVLLDRPLRRSPDLALGMDIATGRGAQWLALVQSLARDLADGNALIRQPMVAAPFAHSVLSGLLMAADHQYQEEFDVPAAAAGAATVRVAQAFIESNAAKPLTVTDIARAAGVGVRGLQQGFQRSLDISPMRYLRHVRLREAHRELRTADPATTTVGEVAARWGFRHQGRFAAEYQQRYGTPPAETLRRF
jgi:AraC-like DNA-binding protein